MDHKEAGRYWNSNADAWTKLARAGYDVYRDYLNTPAFFEMLPDVNDLSGLDIGCGEGHNTRLLAKRGACMTAIDISEVFIGHARESERQELETALEDVKVKVDEVKESVTSTENDDKIDIKKRKKKAYRDMIDLYRKIVDMMVEIRTIKKEMRDDA